MLPKVTPSFHCNFSIYQGLSDSQSEKAGFENVAFVNEKMNN